MEKQKPIDKYNQGKRRRKLLTAIIVIAAIVVVVLLLTSGSTETFRDKYAGVNLETDVSGYGRSNTYQGYLDARKYREVDAIDTDLTRYMDVAYISETVDTGDGEVRTETVLTNEENELLQAELTVEGGVSALTTKANGKTLWKLNLQKQGEYFIRIDYISPDTDVKRKLFINGTEAFGSNAAETLYINESGASVAEAFKEDDESVIVFKAGDSQPSSLFIANGEADETIYLYQLGGYVTAHAFNLNQGINDLMIVADENELTITGITLYRLREPEKKADITNLAVNELYEENSYSAFDYGKTATMETVNVIDAASKTTKTVDRLTVEKTEAHDIEIDVQSFMGDGEAIIEDGIASVFQPDGGETSWFVEVPETAFYNILLTYKTTPSRGVDIERALYVNDELLFSGASSMTFSRLWTDDPDSKNPDGSYKTDNQGNEIRPSQTEVYDWQSAYCKDDMGYTVEPYRFWLTAGENKITLKANNEPMIIGAITITPVLEYQSYAEYTALNTDKPNNTPADTLITIEGESAYLRSSPSLYPKYDRSSPATVPSSLDKTLFNYIGGDAWASSGQWIEWEFEVPEDGYYNITIKARQQYQRGSISSRSLYIDGEIPFDEVSSIAFGYNTSWEMNTLSDENGVPYEFYLTKGTHTIRLEATLGEMGEILEQMEDSIYRLNQIYRQILVLTGVNPDRFRDYNIPKNCPGAIEAMDLESKRLYKLVDDTVDITGQKSDRIAVAQTLAVQLEQFVDRNERITQAFSNFKDNITSLGTALQNMSEIKLDIDEIIIKSSDASLPAVHDSGAYKLWHELKSCVASYFVDYNSLGNKYDDESEHVIEVWIVTGRDQSTVLKTMVDDMFTPESGIMVNVKLVAADALLTAVVAGNGPDVVLSVDSWFAANYAMRNAVEDLTQFDDFDQVSQYFLDSAIVPLTYDDGSGEGGYRLNLASLSGAYYLRGEEAAADNSINVGVYGLPETQVYSLLFYREDILEELGLEVPQTWDDLISMLPTIQGNNMTVGIPYPDISNVDMTVFNSLIYQYGGSIYDANATKTLISDESGISAFKLYTSFFNDYGLPTVFDFVSRFRSGEMPLGISPYTTYNTLSVSAPEIRNLWNFTLIPGTIAVDEYGNILLDTDGNPLINRSVHSSGACCMMIATDDETVKADAWEFMKWWVSTDAQVRFGREMESILGASARYATANTEALRQLAWSSDQLEILEEQQSWAIGFREIAGGYSTTRHMTNAIRRVINTKEDPRETLLTYARTINEEITIKRREFNLPIASDFED